MNLKEALLSFDGVIDNEYLDQYIELVDSTISFSSSEYTELHHAIPASFYYKKRSLAANNYQYRYHIVDADARNIKVRLPFKQHCLAHWLLCMFTVDRLGYSMRAAFTKMIGMKTKVETVLTDEDINILQQLRNQVMLDHTFYWKPDEVDWLINNREKHSIKECAKILQKTYSAVAHKCNELGITRNEPAHRWTAEEIEYLSVNFAETSIDDLASVLINHSKTSINYKARSLGIKKIKLPNKSHPIKVQCIETGEIFCSKAEAQKITGLNNNAIISATKHGAEVSSRTNSKYRNVHFKEII